MEFSQMLLSRSRNQQPARRFFLWCCVVAVLAVSVIVAPRPATAAPVAIGAVPPRTSVSVIDAGGALISSPAGSQPRSSLSLSKLYLGYWVLRNGDIADKGMVNEMIRSSHDGIATTLDRKYPHAINAIIGEFRLRDSSYRGFWGTTLTSTNDVARFVHAIRFDPIALPLIDGMTRPAPVAADGYPQNFGTATLPGVMGTKFGWADARNAHASVSFGAGFVVAAHTKGSAADHTADVQASVTVGPQLPVATPPVMMPLVPGSSPEIPMLNGSQIKAEFGCAAPPEVMNLIPNEIHVPQAVTQAMPRC